VALLTRSRLGGAWLLVAVMTGVITPGYPLALHAAGLSKGQIAVFFAANSLAAFAFSVLTVRRLDLAGRRGVLPALLVASAGGLVLAVGATHVVLVHLGGVLSMLFVAATPLLVRRIQAGGLAPADDAALSARVRSLSVVGYVLGVAAYGAASALPGPVDPVLLGAAATLAAAALAGRAEPATALDPGTAPSGDGTTSGRDAASGRDPASGRDATSGRDDAAPPGGAPAVGPAAGAALGGLALVVAALVLLKSADSLRLVYLPLHVVADGHPQAWASVLFVVTAVVELLVLRRVATSVPGGRARPVLVAAAGLAAASFVLSAAWGGLVALVLSQVVYAGFAALFQALGPVLLGRRLPSGLAGGVGVFGAVLQVGALVGVLAPLLVPGYGAAVLWLATVPCVAAGALLVVLGRLPEPATADAPAGGSPTSATGRGT